MVPQWCLAFLKEVFFFFLCPHLLSKEIYSSGFPAVCSRVLSWGSNARWKGSPLVSRRLWSFLSCSREPWAPERHSTRFPRKYRRRNFGDRQELQKELFGSVSVLWGANTAYHLKPGPGWHTSGKYEFPFLCRTVLPKNQPCLENRMENWP